MTLAFYQAPYGIGHCSFTQNHFARERPSVSYKPVSPSVSSVKAVLLPPLMLDVNANLNEPVASGSFGDVFFGSLKDGSRVVLKRARGCATARALFSREKQINARLRSTNEATRWPAYLGTYSKNSQTFLVWRRESAGRTLEHYLSDCAPYALGQALGVPTPAGARLRVQLFRRVATELLLAASEMHERGVVHRDVKPDNVLVVPSGRRKLQLIDFGAGIITSAPLWSRGLTHVLDPIYAAPELRVALFAPDRFDIFSVALISLRVLLPSLSTSELRLFRTRLLDLKCNFVRYRSEFLAGTLAGGVADAEWRTLFNQNDGASSACFDALAAMLTKSPGDRCTARRALELLA